MKVRCGRPLDRRTSTYTLSNHAFAQNTGSREFWRAITKAISRSTHTRVSDWVGTCGTCLATVFCVRDATNNTSTLGCGRHTAPLIRSEARTPSSSTFAEETVGGAFKVEERRRATCHQRRTMAPMRQVTQGHKDTPIPKNSSPVCTQVR